MILTLYLEHSLLDLQDRDIEGSAAEIEDGDDLVLGLVHAVGQGGRRRLVDYTEHVEAGDLAGILGCLENSLTIRPQKYKSIYCVC